MRLRLWLCPLLFLCSFAYGVASDMQVTVIDAQGKAVGQALVIVQELGPPEREVFRALTNNAGTLPSHALAPGLYRAIAAYPYGHWQTSVREFLVRDQPVKVELRMDERQSADNIPVAIGRLTLHVLDAKGQPAAGARVLVRDAEAHDYSEHWGTTNAQGTTSIDLSDESVVLVVVYRDRLYTFPVSSFDTARTLRLQ